MSATQTVVHEQYELQTPKLTPSTSRAFDSAIPTPADSTTRLSTSARVKSDSDDEAGEPETVPTEGAVEVAPEGGYGWVIVAICSLAK